MAAGVDNQVLRIETAYDSGGRAYLYTSFNAASAGTVVNQVLQVYNGLGQLITEYQSHSGTVKTNNTPNVQYAYSEMAGGANHSRLVSMTYANGRVLNYNYNSGVDDGISRLSSLSDSTGTLEAYSYLGMDTVVRRAHPLVNVDLTYIMQAGETTTDAGDQYTGLDRFGRVIDQRWLRTTTGTHTDRWQYGYDRDGNVLYRNNLVNPLFSELYHSNVASNGYDLLNQLTAFARGLLTSQGGGVPDTIAMPTRSQIWNLDAMGNWSGVTSDGTTQGRQHNRQNEITSISGASTPAYDNNGNTLQDDTGQAYVYDAWNRLVTAKRTPTGPTIVAYAFDGLNRRITETATITTDLYYSDKWQVLEEREGTLVRKLHVWSPVYVDAMVMRYRDTTGSGTFDEKLYVQQDAHFSVTALTVAGYTVERYIYDPYGPFSVLFGEKTSALNPDWSLRGSTAYNWVYLHQGGRFDYNSSLYQVRNRDYSPTLGRWMQNDPKGYQAGDTNLYRYIQNSPVTYTDPTGLDLYTVAITADLTSDYWGEGHGVLGDGGFAGVRFGFEMVINTQEMWGGTRSLT